MPLRPPTTRKLALALLLLLAACTAEPPPAVPVYADSRDLRVLEGHWWGQYWSAETGRSGRIRLSLEASEDRAFGDVLMLPAGRRGKPDDPQPQGPALAETLAIEFVRVDAATETVSGTLAPYRDPDCDCVVATTFTGRVSRNVIEGSFVTQAGGAYGVRRGRWRVERRDGDP